MATYVEIASQTLTTTTASITFSSISADYTDLLVKYSARVNSSAQDIIDISLNGNSSNFSSKLLYGLGSSAGSQSSPAQQAGIMSLAASTANTFSSGEIYLPNYLSSNYKSMSADAAAENNGTSAVMGLFATLWSNSSAITSITLAPTTSGGSFVQYSSFYLYGIKKD